jgi:hypothetical protein
MYEMVRSSRWGSLPLERESQPTTQLCHSRGQLQGEPMLRRQMRLHGTRRVVLKLRVPKTDKPVVTRAAENSCTSRNHRVCLPLGLLAKFLPISRVIWSGIGTGKSTNRKRETFPRQELSVPRLRLFFLLHEFRHVAERLLRGEGTPMRTPTW